MGRLTRPDRHGKEAPVAHETFDLTLTRSSGYRFEVQSARPGAPEIVADEPPPLGEGEGATPLELLGAAVGSCLSSSLLFCLSKARIPVEGLTTRVHGSVERNDQGRLRVSGLDVVLELEPGEGAPPRIDRCIGLFEDFCTVGRSVAAGIPIRVRVVTPAGAEDVR
jgi:uncharacterized OsmC-like protein